MTDKNTQTESDPPVVETVTPKPGAYTGCVKWFQGAVGFGFITVISDGEKKGSDIFVHHSGIKTLNSNYRSLYKGEYVHFDIGKGAKNDRNIEYPHQAVNVTGILGGPLMCDSQTMNYERSMPPRYPPRPSYNAREPPHHTEWKEIPTRGPPVRNTAKYNNKRGPPPPTPPTPPSTPRVTSAPPSTPRVASAPPPVRDEKAETT